MLDQNHSKAVEAILFGSSDAPEWLASSVRECQARYAGLSLTEEFQTAINAFDRQTSRKPFELFVVGEGKFGKSTLVNCLLGEQLSRVRVLPETRCFLRYVLKDEAAPVARFYVRRKKGMHDWLAKRIGPGQRVADLYQVSEHLVALSEAKDILADEISRLDAGAYEPAILEVERDVRMSPRSAFQDEIRIVDTQGLDQLFPDELKKAATGLSESSSQELFIEWMNTTPRGKYLEWQFRRCDSVLWCINAVRIESAATVAALRYFSGYSKKVIIAITNVDRLPKKDGVLDRVLARAHELYEGCSAAICPVNGQAAWEAIISGDANALTASGFAGLTGSIESICTSQGNKVRNLSRYFAIRRTERQYRSSLRSLHAAYQGLHARYKRDRRTIEQSRAKAKEIAAPIIREVFSEIQNEVRVRIDQVSLSDDQYDAERKVGFYAAGNAASSSIRELINDGVIPAIVKVGAEVAPYNLPSFDADGQVSGSLIRVDFEPPRSKWKDPKLEFSLSLESLWGREAWLKFREFFGSEKARNERLARERARRDELKSSFDKSWKTFLADSIKAALDEVDRLYEAPLEELDRVLARLEKEARNPLPTAAKKIEAALSKIAVLPAVSDGMVRALERARGI